MELIFNLVYIYIAVFSIYFFILGIRSLNEKTSLFGKNRFVDNDSLKLALVIYSHNNYDELRNIIKQIKLQKYPPNNVVIHVILDNCNDHSLELIQEDSSIKIMNVNDGVTIGKDQAISILIESQRQDNSFDAYVFLDVDRFIEEDFLANVNKALLQYPVLTGQTIIIDNNNLSKTEKIKLCYSKYFNNFLNKSRSMLGLASNINGSFLCIKKDFLEKVDSLDLKDINSELKYSILLSKIGYPCIFDYNLKTYQKSYNYKLERPSITFRLKMFKQCFSQIFTTNYKFIEHVFSLIAPSALVVSALSIFYLFYTNKYYFMFNFLVVFTIFSMLLLGFAIGILKAELYAKDFLYLIAYPFYSLKHIFTNFPVCRFFNKNFFTKKNKKNIQKYTVKVIATNGKSNIPCKLDLISDNGLAKVVFSFKKKKFTSSRQIRMVEALNELTRKLNDYGFDLKICYCCKYFTSIVDGTQNMVQGECSFEFKNRKPDEQLKTLLWNSCSVCTPKKVKSIIEDIQNTQQG